MSLSIIEFAVYGGVGYFTLALVILLIVKHDRAEGFDRSLSRVMFVIPGLVCIGLLSTFGVDIEIMEIETKVMNGTSDTILTTTVETSKISFQDERWFMIHGMFFTVLVVFFIFQLLEFVVKSHD